jgi:hypothetical protein
VPASINLLSIQSGGTGQVPMVEKPAAEGVPKVLSQVRQLAESDREVMEKGTSAFVSYMRGYREHQVDTSAQHCT